MRPKGRLLVLSLAAIGVATAVVAAAMLKDRALEEWYLHRLDSDRFTEKFRAAIKLGELRSKKAVPRLIVLLKQSEGHNREAGEAYGAPGISAGNILAVAFARIGPAAIPPLVEALKEKGGKGDRGRRWRGYACVSLGFIGTKDAVAPLIDLLEDQDDFVRFDACLALGCISAEARDAVPALTSHLHDRRPQVRDAAAMALKKIQSE